MHFKGLLYRALNPFYASEPLSGEGAKRFGGRFNLKGSAALYTSLSPQTAIRESNQVGSLQPTMLVCYEASINKVFDTNNADLLKSYSYLAEQLSADDWREQMNTVGKSSTQLFSQRLISEGYAGLLVRSFAAGTTAQDQNLVLWDWEKTGSNSLTVIDDERRLSYRFD